MSDRLDGNPLVYALKNVYNWKISKRDIISLLKQFIRISEKIEPRYDTIIAMPSSNPLNTKFLYRLNKIIQCDNKITDQIFSKMLIDEVVDNIDYDSMTKEEAGEMTHAFNQMKGDFFKFKEIPVYLRKYIKNIWNDTFGSKQLSYAKFINEKDILILDDTISSGQTISSYCDVIMKHYTPRSITIITLFSKLY